MELYDWQQPFADTLHGILAENNIALSALPTGSGKTYISSHVTAKLGRPVLVLCPKSVITMWKEVLTGFGVKELLDVLNWEKLKAGHTQWLSKQGKTGFTWHIPADTLVLVDEVHKGASGPKTQTTRALAMLKSFPEVKVLASSATIADSPLKMRALGYLLGLHRFNDSSFYNWCRVNGCFTSPWHTGLEFPKGPKGAELMAAINREIRDKMVKCSLDAIPGFPESMVEAVLFDLDAKYRIQIDKIYKEMDDELKQPGTNALTVQLRARQRTELLKVPLLTDLAVDALAEEKSPVIFVSFRETLDRLQSALSRDTKTSRVFGGQRGEVRDSEIKAFQDNKSNVCIVMIQAGGVAVSLHDVRKERPRVSFITPNFNSTEVIQALGRIHRAGGTNVVQKFVLISGTIETKIYQAIQNKARNIAALTDTDLSLA